MSVGARLRHVLDHYILYRGAPPEDAAAFDAYARDLAARLGMGIGLLLVAVILAVWPTDHLLLARRPDLIAQFNAWRPAMAAVVAVYLMAMLTAAGRRHAVLVFFAFLAVGFFVSTYLFSAVGGLASPLLPVGFCYVFMPVIIPAGLWARLAGLAAVQVAYLAGVFVGDPTIASDPLAPFFLLISTLVSFASLSLGHTVFHLSRNNFLQKRALGAANEQNERLLLNILPRSIADRLKADPRSIADRLEGVTVLFADICGFTPLSESMSPEELVQLLNRIFSDFDRLVDELGLEKIKTIGDAYMVAGGLPLPRPDHVESVAELALRMRDVAGRFQSPSGEPVRMRIGMHTGPVVAGVIGARKFSYDLWGDTVNTASRMESHGEPGQITVCGATRAALGDRFEFLDRGTHKVKGKGDMPLYFLLGRARAAAANG